MLRQPQNFIRSTKTPFSQLENLFAHTDRSLVDTIQRLSRCIRLFFFTSTHFFSPSACTHIAQVCALSANRIHLGHAVVANNCERRTTRGYSSRNVFLERDEYVNLSPVFSRRVVPARGKAPRRGAPPSRNAKMCYGISSN